MNPTRRLIALALATATVSACLEDALQALPDAARDVAVDHPADVAVDHPADVAVDAPADVAVDAPADVAVDAPADVSVDAPADAPADVAIDVSADLPVDVVADASALDDAVTDARAADAAVADVRAADVGYFGPSRCADSGFAICEDFEGDAGYDRDVWAPYASNGTLAVEDTRAARGARALHAHTHAPDVDGGAGANVGLRTTLGFPRVRNTYFGRAFVWMPTRSPTTHSTLFESGGRLVDGGLNVSQRFSISGHQLEASYDSSPRPPITDYARRSATAMPLDRWVCLEWHFKGDTNELHFWVDGLELLDTTVLPTRVPTWFAPDWVRVNVGLQLYRPDPEPDFDLWIDEIAIHPTRVGCRR
jgi:hypothetical protein